MKSYNIRVEDSRLYLFISFLILIFIYFCFRLKVRGQYDIIYDYYKLLYGHDIMLYIYHMSYKKI